MDWLKAFVGYKDGNGALLALMDALLVCAVFFIIWRLSSGVWAPEATPAEGGLYLAAGEEIPLLWKRLWDIKDARGLWPWLIRFVF